MARQAQEVARQAERNAITERNQALVNQSRFLSALARQAHERGDDVTAISLALEALPDVGPQSDQREQSAVEAVLFASMTAPRRSRSTTVTVFFSPDGGRIATVPNDGTVHITDAATHVEVAVLRGHVGEVTAGAFSRDGTRIVTASEDVTARLWDAVSGKQIAVLVGHTAQVFGVAFSPDGALLVTTSWDHTARIWEAASGRQIGVPLVHTTPVVSGAFSPDGKEIVTAADETAIIWNVVDGRQKYTLPSEDIVKAAEFSLDGRRVATATSSVVRLWAADTGEKLYELVPPQR